MKVFISHSGRDNAIYMTLCMVLDAEKIDRWDIREMSAGESLSAQLRTAISKCQICVFIATKKSVKSKWCLSELAAFWGAGKIVVIFMVDKDLKDTDLPPQFKENVRARTPSDLLNTIKNHMLRKDTINLTGIDMFSKKIFTRKELYIEARNMIKSANKIRDTTWGRRAQEIRDTEQQERNLYRDEIKKFMDDDKTYYELLSAEKRSEYLSESCDTKSKYPNYNCRVLRLDLSDLAIMDLMIADRHRVLFSHVSAKDPTKDFQYLIVESEPIAELFIQFFDGAWRDAEDVLEYNRRINLDGNKENE